MSALSANPATETAEMHFGKKTILRGHADYLAEAVRSVWPEKTAINMAACTGLLTRSCEIFLSRKSMPSSGALYGLFDTDNGRDFLLAFMRNSEKAWIVDLRKEREIERIKAERAILDRRLAALTRGEAP